MPYIGHSPTNAGSFIQIDDFSASFNGSTTGFTMQIGSVNITPNVNNLLVTLDGVLQHEEDAYTISGSTINFDSAPPIGASAYIILMGQSASVGQGTIGADELNVSGDGTVGQALISDGDGTFSWSTDAEPYLELAGGTMSGDINLASNAIINGGAIAGTFTGGLTGNVTGNVSGTAPAGSLTGTTLKSTVVTSSLTSVGSLTSLTGNGAPFVISNINNGNNIDIKTTSGGSLVHAVKIHSGGLLEAKQGISSTTGTFTGNVTMGDLTIDDDLHFNGGGTSAWLIGKTNGYGTLRVQNFAEFEVDGVLDINGTGTSTFAGALTANGNVTLNVAGDNLGLVMKPSGSGSTTLRLDTYADNADGRNWAFRNRYNVHGRLELMKGTNNTDSPLTTVQHWDNDGTSTFKGDVTVEGDVKMANGRGISFTASSNTGGMSSELLDDYEEGTFTPTLTNVGSYTTQFGKYTKIGRLVHVAGKLHATGVTVNGTTIILGGLPFDSADESDSAQRSAIRPEGDWGGMGIAFTDGAHFRINGTSAQGVANSGGSSVYWSHNASGMGTTMEFNFSGTYYSN